MAPPDLYALYHFTKAIPHDVYPSISSSNPALALGPDKSTILITGGGTGIGLATAEFYARAGAKSIVITGRRIEVLEEGAKKIGEAGPIVKVHVLQADVSDKDSVAKLWKTVGDKVGKVDVLINNAGRGGARTKIGGGNVDDWLEVLQINLFGIYLMSEAYVASLAATESTPAEEGTIINVSSAMAFATFPGSSAYSISKAAAIRFTEYLHLEHENIRSFSVHPGIIPTVMSTLGDAAKDTVNLAAGLNLYLASPRADYLRGRYTTANWDVDELEKHQEEIVRKEMLVINLVAEYGPEGHVWEEKNGK